MNDKQKLKLVFVLAAIIGSICIIICMYAELMILKRIIGG